MTRALPWRQVQDAAAETAPFPSVSERALDAASSDGRDAADGTDATRVGPADGGPRGDGEPESNQFLGGTFRALRNRNYRLYFIGQSISLSGTWMQTIAQALLVLQITDSKIALGTVTLLQFLPITVFVLFAGVIADRVPKRNFILATQSLAMAQAIILAVLVWSGNVELWHVYVLALRLGLANAFEPFPGRCQPTEVTVKLNLWQTQNPIEIG